MSPRQEEEAEERRRRRGGTKKNDTTSALTVDNRLKKQILKAPPEISLKCP